MSRASTLSPRTARNVEADCSGPAGWPQPDNPDWLAFHFERCWPWLEASLAIQPVQTHSKSDVWDALVSGHSQLWPTANSCSVLTFNVYPTGKKVFFGWLTGGDLDEIKETARACEKHAREHGCDAFAVQGRRGWLRSLSGFEDAGTTIVKDLRCLD